MRRDVSPKSVEVEEPVRQLEGTREEVEPGVRASQIGAADPVQQSGENGEEGRVATRVGVSRVPCPLFRSPRFPLPLVARSHSLTEAPQ